MLRRWWRSLKEQRARQRLENGILKLFEDLERCKDEVAILQGCANDPLLNAKLVEARCAGRAALRGIKNSIRFTTPGFQEYAENRMEMLADAIRLSSAPAT
jgi:hypothetical protein